MTSPETSEEEIEALFEGLDDRLDRLLVSDTDGSRFILSGVSAHNITEIAKEWVRSSLTAAAQVRAQAPLGNPSAQDFLAMQDRCEEFRDALEQIAEGRGITVAKIAEKAVSIARQVLMQDAPTPAPAALGIRKGE